MSTRVDINRGHRIAAYVAGARQREYPDEVRNAAVAALVDFVGVAVGATDDTDVFGGQQYGPLVDLDIP